MVVYVWFTIISLALAATSLTSPQFSVSTFDSSEVEPRQDAAAVVVDGKLMLFSGATGANNSDQFNSIPVFDFKGNWMTANRSGGVPGNAGELLGVTALPSMAQSGILHGGFDYKQGLGDTDCTAVTAADTENPLYAQCFIARSDIADLADDACTGRFPMEIEDAIEYTQTWRVTSSGTAVSFTDEQAVNAPARNSYSAVHVGTNKYLLFGGNYIDSGIVRDPETGKITNFDHANCRIHKHFTHETDVYLYDGVAKTWSGLTERPGSAWQGATSPFAMAMGPGRIFVFGGRASNGEFDETVDTAYVFEYDLESMTFSALEVSVADQDGRTPKGRYSGFAAAVPAGEAGVPSGLMGLGEHNYHFNSKPAALAKEWFSDLYVAVMTSDLMPKHIEHLQARELLADPLPDVALFKIEDVFAQSADEELASKGRAGMSVFTHGDEACFFGGRHGHGKATLVYNTLACINTTVVSEYVDTAVTSGALGFRIFPTVLVLLLYGLMF